MSNMRLTFRLALLLTVGVAAVATGFAYRQVQSERRELERDLRRQAHELAQVQAKAVEPLLARRAYGELQTLVDRFADRSQEGQRLVGMAVYDAAGLPVAITSGLLVKLNGMPPAAGLESGNSASESSHADFVRLGGVPMQVTTTQLRSGVDLLGTLTLFHDASFIERRSAETWRRALASVSLQTILILAITLITIRLGLGVPLQRMAQWLQDLRMGSEAAAPPLPGEPVFEPLTREVSRLASSFTAARAAAEEEARLRDTADSHWTTDRLRVFVQGRLNGSRLVAVSNREPYEHFRRASGIECSVPASGLVTALEPILRACDGTWIAQATGDADRETSDANGRLRVPPDHPQYALRRVWLTEEESQGFYLGFANEGLWPLCHIAHTRPTFRAEDWGYYQEVNQKFAAAVLDEIQGEENPVVVVQDYHFALLPQLIKAVRPDARVAIFWHIPWPNPEAFGICPWQRELLEGLLGADLVGFHIQSHCNNFLETVDRVLESRIERDRSAISRHGHLTVVKRFPISVAMDSVDVPMQEPAASSGTGLRYLQRAELLAAHGVRAPFMGVGVDRVDYTKGIPERFRGLERFFEKYPSYRGEFTFVQIGAPSRSEIKRYHDLMVEVEQEAERINRRFQTSEWRPIVLLTRHHSREEILPYYQHADVCMVTSLHDGMNLVAKEYVASRSDDQGVLILSRFTGACHELVDALVVNPYDTEEMAAAIHRSLEMAPEERRLRMHRMRAVVREHNIYRWAGNLIAELCEIRTAAVNSNSLGGPGVHVDQRAVEHLAVGTGDKGY
jgi:trehalose 6-phosphate synthase